MPEHVEAPFSLRPLSSVTDRLGMDPDPSLISTGSDPLGQQRHLDFVGVFVHQD